MSLTKTNFASKTKLVYLLSIFIFILPKSVLADSVFPSPPKINAESFVLMDAESGTVLAESNSDLKRDPASLTKMMTSYVISEQLLEGKIQLDDTVLVGKNAWGAGNPILKGSSLMFLKPGDKVSVENIVRGIIIQSGNDACIAIADHIAGSEEAFVEIMNDYAKKLNLHDTTFQTVHGLDAENQFTTSKDMAKLAIAIINAHPKDYQIYSEKEFTFNNIKQQNRNGLLWDTTLTVDGVKTGHTEGAGYNLVASAKRDNMRLVSVVMGTNTAQSREIESKKLLTWGFRFFENIEAIKPNEIIQTKQVWFGDESFADLGSDKPIYLTIPRGQRDKLEIDYVYNEKDLKAPLEKYQQIGTMRFKIENEIVGEKPLIVLNEIKKGGFIKNFFDYIKFSIFKIMN